MTRPYGYLLVALHFSFAALLVLTADYSSTCLGCWLAAGSGAALAIWAWCAMGLRRLNVLPQPKTSTELVTAVPYRFIRHPMYTGLLVFCGALVPTKFDYWKLVVWVLLVLTLDAKARLEERLLVERFRVYREYCLRTRRFIPFLY